MVVILVVGILVVVEVIVRLDCVLVVFVVVSVTVELVTEEVPIVVPLLVPVSLVTVTVEIMVLLVCVVVLLNVVDWISWNVLASLALSRSFSTMRGDMVLLAVLGYVVECVFLRLISGRRRICCRWCAGCSRLLVAL